MKIFIVEGDRTLRTSLENFFKENHFETAISDNGMEAIQIFHSQMNTIDIVLLDVTLPLRNGNDVLRQIRNWSNVPVIMLTENNEIDEQIQSYLLGADDYIAKPYSLEIIKLHVDAILKRSRPKDNNLITSLDLSLDIEGEKLYLDGEEIYITPKEFELLYFFMRNENKVLSRDIILDQVWGFDYNGSNRTIDTLIKQLRKKIGHQNHIRTVYGKGYCFEKNKD